MYVLLDLGIDLTRDHPKKGFLGQSRQHLDAAKSSFPIQPMNEHKLGFTRFGFVFFKFISFFYFFLTCYSPFYLST